MNTTESPFASAEPSADSPAPSDKARPGDLATPKRRRRLGAFLVFFLLLIIGLAAAGVVWIRTSATGAVNHASADQIITVGQGTSLNGVIAKLNQAGIVKNPTALKIYLRITGDGGNLKAGDYKFDSPISPLQAIQKIQRGEVALERVTIPEGFNRFDIAAKLAEATGKATKEEFLELMNDTSLIKDLAPDATNLEGYLFPETYSYSGKDSAEDLIRAMVERFKEVFKLEWRERALELDMSPHDIVTLASIIEEEAKVPEERPRMSSVFYNRMKIGMPLATDPTFIYAAILANDYDGNPNQPRHRARDSRYNTYKYAGLPPGPIASPGRASLEAALYPEGSDYLYFVLKGTDGSHIFSRTGAEHDAAREEYYKQREIQRQQQQQSGKQ